MNTREKTLLLILVVIVLAGVFGFGGWKFVWEPYRTKKALVESLTDTATKKQKELADLKEAQANMALYKSMSLPANADFARSEYGKYLRDMLAKNGFKDPVPTVTVTPADDKEQNKKVPGGVKKEPPYQKVNVRVVAEGPLENVDKVLEEFYRTPLLHQIHDLTLERPLTPNGPGRDREVKMVMTIEALIVTGADKHSYLLRGVEPKLLAIDTVAALRREPLGFGMALDAISPAGRINGPYRLKGMPHVTSGDNREYAAIAWKNVFYGPPPEKPPPDTTPKQEDRPADFMATRFVRLNHLYSGVRVETHLYDVSTDHMFKTRASLGYNTFPFIKDGYSRSVVLGTVVKVDDEEWNVYFRVDISSEDPPGKDADLYHFYKLDKKELEKLVTDKVITKEDSARTLRVSPEYWESLKRTNVIRPREKKDKDPKNVKDFYKDVKDLFCVVLRADGSKVSGEDSVTPNEILIGKVVKSNHDEVLIVTDERFYQIHIGWTMEDALDKQPLSAEQVKKHELKEKD
jgi:hypothetical protein